MKKGPLRRAFFYSGLRCTNPTHETVIARSEIQFLRRTQIINHRRDPLVAVHHIR